MEEYITQIIHCDDCGLEFIILPKDDRNDIDEFPLEITCPTCMNEDDFTFCSRKIMIEKARPT